MRQKCGLKIGKVKQKVIRSSRNGSRNYLSMKIGNYIIHEVATRDRRRTNNYKRILAKLRNLFSKKKVCFIN